MNHEPDIGEQVARALVWLLFIILAVLSLAVTLRIAAWIVGL